MSMLRELHISNLAIIENIDIELAPGLNVFTGQTGSGKSLILGALELLLGLRGGGGDAATLVRPGCREARVSGLFEIAGADLIERLGGALDQALADDEPILITRRVAASGRSSVSVNGQPATAGMLRKAGQMLVDIHGQHDQQFLLKPANQLAILDAFAGAGETRRQFAETLAELRASQRRLVELRQSEEKRLDSLDLYRFQIDEIDAVDLHPGEYDEARARYNVLRNVSHLQALSARTLEALADGDETVLERVGALQQCGQELVRMDPGLADFAAQLAHACETLGDAARSLERYQDALDADPSQLAEVEERLDILNRMIHKYARSAEPGSDPVEAVLEYRRRIGLKVEQLEADAQTLGDLDDRIARSAKALASTGKRLTALRSKAGKRLKPLIEEQFRELEMNEATFEVAISSRSADDAAVDSSGLDVMDFMVRTNPGQEMLPLRKIASGGEISRIMLAIKTILAGQDQVTVLIFDEIDANIGDRLGATIGQKMRALAHGRRGGAKSRPLAGQNAKAASSDGDSQDDSNCQIICITHLSQIAACADHHLQIRKEVVGGKGKDDDSADGADRRTVAKVRVLSGEQRVQELAEMMAGTSATAATITHARNLLTSSKPKKRPTRPRGNPKTNAVSRRTACAVSR